MIFGERWNFDGCVMVFRNLVYDKKNSLFNFVDIYMLEVGMKIEKGEWMDDWVSEWESEWVGKEW